MPQALDLLKALVRRMRKALLSGGAIADKAAELVWEQANALDEKYRLFKEPRDFSTCLQLCRIYALAATCENSGKHKESIRRHAFRLRTLARSKYLDRQAEASRYEGWLYFCLGDPETAISWTETSIAQAHAAGQEEAAAFAENNLAYFTAAFLDRERRKARPRVKNVEMRAMRDRALKFLEGQIEELEKGMKPGSAVPMRLLQLRDTLGYLLIATGDTTAEVQQGVDQCRMLLAAQLPVTNPLTPVARAYAEGHVARGWERLAQLSRLQVMED